MPRVVQIYNSPTLKVATTEAGLASGQGVECQVTSAIVTAQPTYQTIPSTGCAGASQSPGLTGYQLELAWLQDWNAAAPGGLSYFAYTNDGGEVWFELTPDSADATTKLTGHAFCSAGGFGGTFGDGSAATATATWPLVEPPEVPAPAAAADQTATGPADTEPAEPAPV